MPNDANDQLLHFYQRLKLLNDLHISESTSDVTVHVLIRDENSCGLSLVISIEVFVPIINEYLMKETLHHYLIDTIELRLDLLTHLLQSLVLFCSSFEY